MLILAVCDDDKTELEKIAVAVKEWIAKQSKEDISIKVFSSPYSLLSAITRGEQFDLFLLDILMPEMTGITLGEQLQNLCKEPLIIYLTHSEDYYPDAFRIYAFQYLCKPIRKPDLFEVLNKALTRLEKHRQNVFTMKTPNGIVQLPLHTIIYVELSAHICNFHLADGTICHSRYLRTGFDNFIAPLLRHGHFIKTHTAFMVNLNYAGRLTPNSLTMTTGVSIPVTRAFSNEVQKRYMEYALRDKEGTS